MIVRLDIVHIYSLLSIATLIASYFFISKEIIIRDIKNLNQSLRKLSIKNSNYKKTKVHSQGVIDLSNTLSMFLNALIAAYQTNEQVLRENKMQLNAIKNNNNIRNLILGLTHDLKSPTCSSLSIATSLINEDFGKLSDPQIEMLTLLKSSLVDQQTITNNIIDYSKSQNQDLKANIRSFLLNEIFDEWINLERFNAASSGGHLLVDEIPEIKVIADPSHIKRILLNFTSNAIKHTEKSSIHIKFKSLKKYLEIIVHDSGEGITDDIISNILRSNHNMTSNQSSNGSGLGLLVAKQLADTNRCKISYQNDSINGSNFILSIPAVERLFHNNVLIVEDDQAVANSLMRFLRHNAKNLTHYKDLANSIRFFFNIEPDLVIVDFHIGEQTCLPLIRIVPESTPIILISGDLEHKTQIEKLRKKNIVFFEKPLQRKQLQSALNELHQ